MAERIYSRAEILDALRALGLSKSWLAERIDESRQTVANWLRESNPMEPQDPSAWKRMTEALNALGAEATSESTGAIQDIGLDLATASLIGDTERAKELAAQYIKEITALYKSRVSKKVR